MGFQQKASGWQKPASQVGQAGSKEIGNARGGWFLKLSAVRTGKFRFVMGFDGSGANRRVDSECQLRWAIGGTVAKPLVVSFWV